MNFVEFKNIYNLNLNPQQEAAVQSTEGATLLLAVPGSGKTTVLISRLGYMIYAKHVEPSSILTMTYTVAAATDMKNRFVSFFSEKDVKKLQFRTINGVCYSIIRKYLEKKDSYGFDLLDNNLPFLTDICKQLIPRYLGESEIKSVQQAITYIKNMRLSQSDINELEVEGIKISPIYNAYIAGMKSAGKMDYDDQLVYALRILNSNPDILEYFQHRYRYICVDEAQDTSKIQHEIIAKLASKYNNIFMVGDEDQSIYGFRAAYPEALLNFEYDYPNAKVLFLEQNYRSSKEIVNAANLFISRNKNRRQKHMFTDRSSGNPIRNILLSARTAQYSYISKLAESSPQLETAILYRNNDSAIPLVDQLVRKGISFRCRQAETSFFDSRVVRDVKDIIALSQNPRDGEAFMRVYYKMSCKISKEAAKDAVILCSKNKMPSIFDALIKSNHTPDWAEEKIIELKNNLIHLKTDNPKAAMSRIQFKIGYGGYVISNGSDTEKLYFLSVLASREETIEGFLKRLAYLKSVIESGGDPNPTFILSTIHASKGLEYERVAIIDAIDGVLPSLSNPNSASLDADQLKALEEERRLFYVAVTRAKNDLLLFNYDGTSDKYKCSFISQLFPPTIKKQEPGKLPTLRAPSAQKQTQVPSSDGLFMGANVFHTRFGYGSISELDLNNDKIAVTFDSNQTKVFGLSSCITKGLLKAVN